MDHFKSPYWIYYSIASALCFDFFWPWGMWDLSSLTRDQTHTPCTGRFILFGLFSFIYLFLFLAVLGLCCCVQAFSSCGTWACHWSGFSCCGAWALGAWVSVAVVLGLSCPARWGIFPEQELNPCAHTARQILNH